MAWMQFQKDIKNKYDDRKLEFVKCSQKDESPVQFGRVMLKVVHAKIEFEFDLFGPFSFTQ